LANSGVFELIAGTVIAAGDVLPYVSIADNTQSANGSLKKITITNFMSTIPVPVVVTSASANALAIGRLGSTTPAFTVDASTASQVAGLKVVGAVTTGTVAVVVTDSGAVNTNLTINALGTGTIGIGSVSTGRVTITPVTTITGALTLSAALTYGGVTLSNAVTGTGNMVLSASPTLTGTVVLTGTTITGTPTWSSTQTMNITGNASGSAGSVAASGVTAGTFGAGAFTFQSSLAIGGALSGVTTLNASGLITGSSGLTISSGTTAVQALTATTASLTTANVNSLAASGWLTPSGLTVGGWSSAYGSIGYGYTPTAATTFNYAGSDFSSRIQFSNGGIDFYTAPSGTAGNPITFTKQLAIAQTGAAVFSAGISATTGTFSTSAKTASGSQSCLTGAFTTIFTPAGAGSYWIYFYDAGGANLSGDFRVMWDGTNALVAEPQTNVGTNQQISGTAVQIQQSSGSTKTMNWTYMRLN
jgi:fibronectin-binding autotransporter adhesin